MAGLLVGCSFAAPADALAAPHAHAAPALHAPAAPAHEASGGLISVTWSGSVNWTEVYNPADPAIEMTTGAVTWQYDATFRDTPSGGTLEGQPNLTVSGKLTAVAAPPNQAIDCTGKLSARPGAPLRASPPARVVTQGARMTLSWITPWTGEWVQSSGAPNSGCATTPNSGSPSPPCGPNLQDLIQVATSSLPYTRDYAVSGTGTVTGTPSGPVNCWMSASAEVAFGGAGSLAGPFGPTPGRYRAKALAAIGLQSTLQQMLYPCLAAGATAPLIGLGPPGQIAALVIGVVSGPLCLAYVKTVNALAAVLADPPLRSYRATARVRPARGALTLPSCSQSSGAAATLCAALEPALQTLLSAAQRTESVAAATSTTIARETGAMRAHNATAVRRQDALLATLDAKLAADYAAQSSAGAGVAAAVGPSNLPLTLTSGQASSAITAVLSAMRRAGASPRALSLIRGMASAQPSDWLAALSSP